MKPPRTNERRLLVVDLAFPLLYGGAYAIAVLFARSMLGLPPRWLLVLLAPVVVMVVADWTENLALLTQLGQFESAEPVSAGWIRVASTATILKFLFLVVSFIETIGLAIAVCVARRA